MLDRMKSSLLLAPVVFLLLCWIACFGNVEMIIRIGVPMLLVFGVFASIVLAHMITLFLLSIAELKAKP